jgi:hypothetical protein
MSHLSEAARLEYYIMIGASLPAPVEATEAHRESRLGTAVEAFNALRPANAYEALLAAQIVVCGVHAMDCLRDASSNHDDFNKSAVCRNQAASMMREARAARRILAQEQKQRLGIEAVFGAQHAQQAVSLPPQPGAPRAASLPPVPAAEPAPMTAPQHPAAPPLHLVATGDATAQPAMADAAPAPSPEAIALAEAFTIDHLIAAAQIREDGGVTPQNQALFRGVALPADPAVMDALVRGRSPILDALNGLNQELAA